MYELRFDKDAEETYRKADDKLAGRLNRCFEQLRQNPLNHAHPITLKIMVQTIVRIDGSEDKNYGNKFA